MKDAIQLALLLAVFSAAVNFAAHHDHSQVGFVAAVHDARH
jgi:hypothetical protein